MSKTAGILASVGLALGLLAVAHEGASKPPSPPPATCDTCPIVYSQTLSGDREDLMLMKPDGSAKTLLLAGASHVQHKWPVWAPDGQWIAFKSNRDGMFGIWVIKRDGTGLKKLHSPCLTSVWNSAPAWRPSSTAGHYWLAYEDYCEGQSYKDIHAVSVDLSTVPVLEGEPVCLTCSVNPNQDYWSQPAWTRDGLHFSARRYPGAAGGSDHEYVVFDFHDGDVPWLDNPRSLDFSEWSLTDPDSVRDGVWAHNRNTLAARYTATGALWLFDVDHDAAAGENIVTNAVNLSKLYVGWVFYSVHWSSSDDWLVLEARGPEGWGLFAAQAQPYPWPVGGLGVPIAPSDMKRKACSPDWNPVAPDQ